MAREFGHALGIETELPCTAAHLHARAAQIEIGIDPDRQPRTLPDRGRNGQRTLDLARRFAVQRHAGRNRRRQLGIALARTGKARARRVDALRRDDSQLACRGDVEPVDQSVEQGQQRPEGVGLDRVMQADPRRQRRA